MVVHLNEENSSSLEYFILTGFGDNCKKFNPERVIYHKHWVLPDV